VEDDMRAGEPTEDGVNDGEHLFDLNMLVAKATGTFGSEPIAAIMATEAFETARVIVNMSCDTGWREKADAVPLGSETEPPGDVLVCGFGDAASSEGGFEPDGKVVETLKKSAGGGNDLRGKLQKTGEFLEFVESTMRAL
jgi:hypothetical protein